MVVRMEKTTAIRTPSPAGERRRRGIDRYYRRVSRLYGLHEGWFEKALRERALGFLSPVEGENILEIGCGTGLALRDIARRVGPHGACHGLDISFEMLIRARTVCRDVLGSGFSLVRSDAARLPYGEGVFDAVCVSGVLELYDDPERIEILGEVRRVLKPDSGRLVLATMADDGRASGVLRFYEWVRRVLPGIVPCRSVEAERLAAGAGLAVGRRDRIRLRGLVPIQILFLRPAGLDGNAARGRA